MLKYKLTSIENTTYNNTKWEIGKSIQSDGKIKELCNNSWLHYYHTPELAVLMNPLYGYIKNARLYECEAEGEHIDDNGLKGGCTKLTLLKEMELIKFNNYQLFNILYYFAKEIKLLINFNFAKPIFDLLDKYKINLDFKKDTDIYKFAEMARNELIKIHKLFYKTSDKLEKNVCSFLEKMCFFIDSYYQLFKNNENIAHPNKDFYNPSYFCACAIFYYVNIFENCTYALLQSAIKVIL